MSTEIQEYAVTFGVQYGRLPDADQHPQGFHGDEYIVIEAPDEVVARKIVFAIVSDRWAGLYPLEEFVTHPMRGTWHPNGEVLRIAWQTPDQMNDIMNTMESIVEGHPATPDSTLLSQAKPGEAWQISWYKNPKLRKTEAAIITTAGRLLMRDADGDHKYMDRDDERIESAVRIWRGDILPVPAPEPTISDHMDSVRDRFAAMGSPRAVADKAEAVELEKRAAQRADRHRADDEAAEVYANRPTATDLLEEADNPFIWDGRGPLAILAVHAHVHEPSGTCLKNRFGALCTPLVQSGEEE
ncbi:hypothetical protein HOT31_gp124 [Microbacterium phage Hendrix]|uniref:Uncharacterized protein n=1 Tax=Microbacterium phage Hendrix TaxID=2182341 RepID=A0A2U8UUD9_9CAUD|nr:hypothetical protein HOT31_gp124 [Microbacterium phage Hendrix]AWN07794.1 hypothetical protein PBI_HENDRIX_123 [Microbacterium phage Hendrix]